MSLDKTSKVVAADGAASGKKNPLVKMIACGNVRLSIFENASQQFGESTMYYTVTVSRSYRDRTGKWLSTSTFYKSHLPQLMYACQRALAFVEEAESESVFDPPF
jgi:hypothetical protein